MYRIMMISALWCFLTTGAVAFAAVVAPAGTLANAPMGTTAVAPAVTPAVTLEDAPLNAPLAVPLAVPKVAPAVTPLNAPESALEGTPEYAPAAALEYAPTAALEDAPLGAVGTQAFTLIGSIKVAPAVVPAVVPAVAPKDTPFGVSVDAMEGTLEGTPANAMESGSKVVPKSALIVVPASTLVHAPLGVAADTREFTSIVATKGVTKGAPAIAPAGAQIDVALNAPESALEGTPEYAPAAALEYAPTAALEDAPLGAVGTQAFTLIGSIKVAPAVVPAVVPAVAPKDAPFGVSVDAMEGTLEGTPANAMESASKVVPKGALLVVPAGTLVHAPLGVAADTREFTSIGATKGVTKGAPAIAPSDAQIDVALYAPESAMAGTTANAPVGTTAVALAVTLEGTPADVPEVAPAVALAFTPQNTLKGTQVNTPEVALLNAPLAVPLVALAFTRQNTLKGTQVNTPEVALLNAPLAVPIAVPKVAPAVTPLNAPPSTPAQPSLLQTDSLTYALYLNKEWKALLTETRRALSEGIDFYYLRVRAGIAAYELKNYRLAAMHLAKAYEWNTSDELVNYWYYYALLMGSRADEANALSETFPPQFLQRMEIRPKRGVNSLTAEAQVSVNTDHASLLEDAIGGSSYLAYRNVLKRQTYKGFGIDHRVAPRLYAFHGISHLGIDRMQMYRSPTIDYKYESSAWQFQYYLQGRYLLPKGWSVTSSATLLLGSALSHWLSFSNAGVPIRNASTYSISDGFVSAAVAKELTHLRPKLSVSYGKVRGYRQFQTTGQLLFYPAGNPNFYLSSSYTLHRDESNPDLKTIFSPRAGLKTGPLWWSAGSSTGVMKHYSASDGYVVYNMNESISGLYDISVYLPLLKYRLGVTARYQVADKEGFTFDYSNATRYTTAPYTYTENSFLISIRYNL